MAIGAAGWPSAMYRASVATVAGVAAVCDLWSERQEQVGKSRKSAPLKLRGVREIPGDNPKLEADGVRSMFKKGNDTRPAEFDHDDFAPPGHHWDEKTERFVPGPKPEPVRPSRLAQATPVPIRARGCGMPFRKCCYVIRVVGAKYRCAKYRPWAQASRVQPCDRPRSAARLRFAQDRRGLRCSPCYSVYMSTTRVS
jgi:hypothetical protein